MELNELRIGNCYYWEAEGKKYLYRIEPKDFTNYNYRNFEPIELSEDVLLKCLQFEKLPFTNILNTFILDLGRNRILSLGNLGSSNEMLWLCERNPTDKQKIDDLICIHNYDYDGKLYLHKLQNICYDLKTELIINL